MGKIGDVYYVVSLDAQGIPQLAKKEGTKAGDQFSKGFGGRMKAGLKGQFGQSITAGLGLGAGLGAVQAMTAGVGALTDAVFSSIDAASDQREAFALTDQVFEGNTESMKRWAESAAEEFGQSETEALSFASNFGNAFKNVGFSLDETSDKAKEMTELAADLGSAFNAGSDEAALALRSGLLGESEPLRRFGVFLDEAKVKAKAMQLGIAEAGEVLSDNQKVTARYALIMEQTADSQGMFGRDSESLADTQKRLQAELENVQAEIGEKLLPIMVDLANFAEDELIPTIEGIVSVFELLDGKLPETREEVEGFLTLAGKFPNVGVGAKLAADMVAAETDRMVRSAKGVSDAVAARGGEMRGDLGDVGEAYDDLADDAKGSSKIVRRETDHMGESFEDYADRILGIARDVVTTAYDIIEDKAELSAATVESTELRKVIATGNATRAQKDRYRELGEVQAQLLLDLKENGISSGKAVNRAMNDIRQRLKTATGQERKALLATLAVLNRLAARANTVAIRLSRLVALARPLGLRSGPQEFAEGGIRPAGVPSWVGEEGPELSVPLVPSLIIPNAESMALTGSAGGGDTFNNNITMLERFTATSVRDLGWGLRELGEQGHLGRKR